MEPPAKLEFVQEASVPITSRHQRRQMAQQAEVMVDAVVDTPEVWKSAMA